MLYPFMLLGLLGLAVPIVIHLIQRQRLRPQVLATMHFLEPEDTANAFAPVPRDWLQLLLRLLLLGLFVLLMVRVALPGDRLGPRTMAVILDHSLSMQRRAGATQSLFERHKQHVLELIDEMGPEDRMTLMLVGDRVEVETGFLQDKEELREIAERFEVSDGGGLALLPAIASAVRQLGSRHEVNACVLVFSDHQRASYPGLNEATDEQASAAQRLRGDLDGGRVKLLLIDEPPEEGPNLSVERARFDPEKVYVGGSSRLTAVVRNHSDAPRSTTVRFSEGEQAGAQRSLTLGPRETAHVDLVHRFESPLDSACRVEIDEDTLAGDNRYHLPMRIHDRTQVLLVAPPGERPDEERGLEAGYRATDLLGYALNPGEALGKGAGTAITVKRLTPQRLTQVSLPIYSIIILQGVTELPEQSIKDLTAFVNNGGGVWLIPGSNVSPLRFNETYSKLLKGFAIGQLKQADPVASIDRSEARITHPLFLPLLREEWGNTRDVYFRQYYVVQATGSAQTPLRAAGGDWLAAVVPHSRGRVFVQLHDGSLESTSLGRSTAFVSLIQQTASYLGRHDANQRPDVMRVGEVLRVDLPEFRSLKGKVDVKGPEERSFPLSGPDDDEIRVEGLLKAGPYLISHKQKQTGRPRWLTVDPVVGESDLTAIDDEAQATLFGTRNVVRLPFIETPEHFQYRSEITAWAAALVLLLFAVEALAGAWQGRRKPEAGGREAVRA